MAGVSIVAAAAAAAADCALASAIDAVADADAMTHVAAEPDCCHEFAHAKVTVVATADAAVATADAADAAEDCFLDSAADATADAIADAMTDANWVVESKACFHEAVTADAGVTTLVIAAVDATSAEKSKACVHDLAADETLIADAAAVCSVVFVDANVAVAAESGADCSIATAHRPVARQTVISTNTLEPTTTPVIFKVPYKVELPTHADADRWSTCQLVLMAVALPIQLVTRPLSKTGTILTLA